MKYKENIHIIFIVLLQCCATFLQLRHTKYCLRVMAAHQPHFAYIVGGGGGELVYGIDWPRKLLINRPQPKNVLFGVHNYPSLLFCRLFEIYSLFINIMRGENFVAHLDGLSGTPVAHHCPIAMHNFRTRFRIFFAEG
jgi:hypothetical protein